MRFTSAEIVPMAAANGFNEEVVEKVFHLLNLLTTLNAHPALKGKWVLKGGTALNLFVFRHPRLSVDIDLNYIGALGREEMLAERPRIEKALHGVFARENFVIRRVPGEHAGGKWRLNYASHTGQSRNLEVDLNFMYRQPLWELEFADSHPLGNVRAKGIPVLELHELAAGKLAALLSRRQARDPFDSHRVLQAEGLQHNRLRVAFVVYGGMNRKDWRTVSVEDVTCDRAEFARQLAPTLRSPRQRGQAWREELATQLVEECKTAMGAVLPFNDSERAFLDLLLDEGQIDATILTTETSLQERIQVQPMLEWKAFNVRRRKNS